MMSSLSRWLRSPRTVQNRTAGRKKTSCKLHLEALEDRVVPAGFNFADFSDVSALTLVGDASVAGANQLRLTPAVGGQEGAAWYSAEKMVVGAAFQSTFQFQMTENFDPPGGSDGFVFILQNTSPTFLAGGGGALGYNGLANSLAVEFDTFQNSENADPSASHISVHTNGTGANSVHESLSLGSYSTMPSLLDDAAVHTAKIAYTPGTLSIYLDNLTTPVLTVTVDLAEKLGLDAGQAWVGFTAATGGGWQNHDILNWNFTQADFSTRVAVNDVSALEGNSGTVDYVFTVTRAGDTSVTTTVNWATANRTAVAGSDYTAASGQVVFGPTVTQQTITVHGNGDTLSEAHETFVVLLSGATGGTIVDGVGIGTILNEDVTLSIADASVVEGSLGYRFADNFVAPDGYGLAAARNLLIGADGNIYVASHDTDVVKVFEAGTGLFLRDLGTSGGELDGPWGMVFGPDGRLYVGGRYSQNIVRFDVGSGAYDVFVAAANSGGLGVPRGLAFGPDGNLYASSRVVTQTSTTDTVKRYDGTTGAYLGDFVTAGSGGLDNANGVAFGPDTNLYVASTRSGEIKRYNGQTGAFIDTFIPAGSGGLGNPTQFLFHNDGYLYVTDNTANVYRYVAATGAFVDVFASSPTGGSGLAFAPSGEFYVSLGAATLQAGSTVVRYTPASWAVFTVQLSNPSALPVTVGYATAAGTALAGSDYVQTSGTLTFAPGETTKAVLVQTVDNTIGEPTETFTVNLSNPVGATITDGQGVGTILDNETKFFVVNDATANETYEYGSGGGAVETYALNSGNTAPRGVASTAAGTTVWVVDANKKVYVYNVSGGLLGSWTAGSLAANATVEGIATNGTDIWIVDNKQDKVFKYTGAATRLSGSQNATSSFSLNSGNTNPKDIVTDGVNFWVVNDSTTDKVFKYTLNGSLLGSWTIGAVNAQPTGITIDPSSVNHIWIVDAGTDTVYQYDNAATRTSGSQNPSSSFALAAGNTNPQGIADPPTGSPSAIDIVFSQQAALSDSKPVTPVQTKRGAVHTVKNKSELAASHHRAKHAAALVHSVFADDEWIQTLLSPLQRRWGRGKG